MFRFRIVQTRANIKSQDEMDGILKKLDALGYKPFILAISRAATEIGGFPIGPETMRRMLPSRRGVHVEVVGDLFITDDQAFLLRPLRESTQIWHIWHHEANLQLEQFCSAVEDAAKKTLDGRRLRGMTFDWREGQMDTLPQRVRWRRAGDLQGLPSTKADYTPDELNQARLLTDEECRRLLIKIANVEKARTRDVTRDVAPDRIKRLQEGGLLRTEYLVVCRSDSHTILSIKSKKEVSDYTDDARCPVCNRPLGEELVEDIVMPSECGQGMLTKSKWMSIWITSLLENEGVSRDLISWNITSGEDEIDIAVNLQAYNIFFEIKDRDFGLGDAYPFAYRMETYGGQYGLILTTGKVAKEAKEFLHRRTREGVAHVNQIAVLEGPQEIEQQIGLHLHRASVFSVLAALEDPIMGRPADIGWVLRSWMQTFERGGLQAPKLKVVNKA